MTESKDRRKSKRVPLLDDFHVLDAQTGEMLGYLRDLSSHGLMVRGASELTADHVYKLAIVLPEPVVGVNVLQVEATCRWHTFDPKRQTHRSGFQFSDLPLLEKHIVEQIQTEYQFSISESSL